MRVLVTGATGFVGKTLCNRLRHDGHAVVRALRQAAPHADALQLEDVVVGDLVSAIDWREVLRGVDAVVHLAAHVHHISAHSNDAQTYHQVNAVATEQLACAAASAGLARFVFLSSVKVHGESTPATHPFTESDLPDPRDDYGRSKWEAEKRLSALAKSSGMAITILRPPLVYGPGVGANFLDLLRLAASKWPLPFASIRNKRSLIYVDNLADAIMQGLQSVTPEMRTFLVSDQHDLSTTELVQLMRHELGVPGRLIPCPASVLRAAASLVGASGQARRLTESLQVDSHLISSRIGWRPPVSAREGIARVCKWYMSTLGERNTPG